MLVLNNAEVNKGVIFNLFDVGLTNEMLGTSKSKDTTLFEEVNVSSFNSLKVIVFQSNKTPRSSTVTFILAEALALFVAEINFATGSNVAVNSPPTTTPV